MIREQHTFGANAINSLLIAFNRFSRDFLPQNYQTNVGALWGVDWLIFRRGTMATRRFQ